MHATQQGAFRLLLTAIGVSALGSRITRTALPMAAILLLGATPLQLGWLSVLGVLPGALVAWWAGAWIDRRSRRAVLIGADCVRALLIATIPVTALLGTLTLIQLGVVAALVCMAGVLFEIADHAYLPVIVPSGHLVAANSKRETVDALAEITGPPLGGALVQWLTAPFALAIDACSFVVSALLIGRIRAREPLRDRLRVIARNDLSALTFQNLVRKLLAISRWTASAARWRRSSIKKGNQAMKLARAACQFVIVLALFVGTVNVSATPITLTFSGSLTSSFGSLNAGNAFSGSYTFDPLVAATGNSSFAVFNNLLSASLTIGSFFATIGPGTGLAELQQDNVPGADRYALVGRNPVGSALIGGLNISLIGFRLDGTSGTAISNALTLLTNPSLASFTSNTFLIFFGEGANLQVVTGTLNTLKVSAVPEPGTLVLLAAALFAAGVMGRRVRTAV